MKRFFTLAITLILLVSISFTSFANVRITHIYKGKSLVEGDNNEYFFTIAKYEGEEEATDFGVKIGGKNYSVVSQSDPDAVATTNIKKTYGIGICDPKNALTDKYEVIPYVVIGGVEITGEPTLIYKPFLYEKMESTGGFDGTAAMTDDTNSNTRKYSDWYTPTGIYMQTNIYNGADLGYNETLSRGLVQIDLDMLDGVDPTMPVTLKVVGRAQYNKTMTSENLPDSMTVNVFGFYGYDWKASMPGYVAPEEGEEDTAEPVYEWSESTVNPSAGYIGPRLEALYEMPLLDSFTVARPIEGDTGTLSGNDVIGNWISYEIDVKDIVASAIKAGEDKVTVAILADNRDRVQYSPVGENDTESNANTARDEIILVMGTKDNTTASRRPSLSYYRYNDEYSQLSTIKVNGTEISGFDSAIYEYSVAYEKGASIPVITAECINEESRAVITQATEENKTATITVYDEQNIRSKTYTVNFEAGLPSELNVSSAAVTADAHSRVNEISPEAVTMYTNLYNGVAYSSGLEATLKRGYVQVNVSSLENVDLTKDVYLNISGKNTYNTAYITEYCPTEFTVNVYGAYKSEFTWDETTAAAVTANTFGPNLTEMKNHFVSSFTVEKADAGENTGNINGPNQTEQINITELVRQALSNGDEYITLIFSADNSDRATDELKALYASDSTKRDSLSFTIYTKEYSVEALRPSVSYFRYNDEYTDLSSIEINGEAIADFDPAVYSYEATYESGSEIPVVTATAFDNDAEVTVEPASEENGLTATITVANGSMTAKTYTVTFTATAPSYETTLLTAVTADAHSRVNEIGPDKTTMFTNLYNSIAYVSGLESTLKRGFVQVSVSTLENIDLTKDVYLNISGRNSYNTGYISEYCPAEFTVNVYGAYQSEFTWDETTAAAVTANTFGPNLTEMKNHFVSSFTVEKADAGENTGNISGPVVTERINITELVRQALSNGDEYITLIFSADNSDRATDELKALYASDTTKRDNLSFTIFTKEYSVDAYKPSVTYFSYEAPAE